MLLSLQARCQFSENFESGVIPAGWAIHATTDGTAILQAQWRIQPPGWTGLEGIYSAFIDRENIGMGNTAEHWLISPPIVIHNNDELSFLGRLTLIGNQGTDYEVRVTNGSQTDYSNYIPIASWTEDQYSTSMSETVQQTISLSNYANSTIHIAFIKKQTQPTTAMQGDRWIIDKIKVQDALLRNQSFQYENLKFYPNPTQSVWNFNARNEVIEKIEIFDVLGKALLTVLPNDTLVAIDASRLNSGMYLAKVSVGAEEKTVRLIKE